MSGDTKGAVQLTLRLEGLCIFAAAMLANSKLGFSWDIFALFFFAPDISLIGYLAGPRIGAITYNSGHSYIGVIVCLVAGYFLPAPTLSFAGIIWCAHIGFDRALGFGLKYPAEFGFTHLGLIGRSAQSMPNPSFNLDAVLPRTNR